MRGEGMSNKLSLSELLDKNMDEAAALSNLIYCVGRAALFADNKKDHDTAALAMLALEEIAGNLYGELELRMYEAQLLEKKARKGVEV